MLESSEQLVYVAWLVVQCLRDLRVQVCWDCWLSYGSPSSSNSSSLTLIQVQGFLSSDHGLAVSIRFCLNQPFVGPYRMQPCYAPDCKHTVESAIVSGLGASPWDVSQFGPFPKPCFSQSLFPFSPCSSIRQAHFWVKVFDCVMATPALHLMSCCSIGGGFHKIPLTTVGHFIYCLSLWVMRFFQLYQVSSIL